MVLSVCIWDHIQYYPLGATTANFKIHGWPPYTYGFHLCPVENYLARLPRQHGGKAFLVIFHGKLVGKNRR